MANNQASIFTKVRRESPDKIVWENERYFVLNDIHPQAQVHFLVIPKSEIATLPEMPAQEIGDLIETANQVAQEQFGLRAYQLMINVNAPYQEIFHVHVHIKSDQQSETK